MVLARLGLASALSWTRLGHWGWTAKVKGHGTVSGNRNCGMSDDIQLGFWKGR
jgi:hypothetical protein